MKENLLDLDGQITSASGKQQKLKAEQDKMTPLAGIQGRICNRCYQTVTHKPPVNSGWVRAATTARSEKNTPRQKPKYHHCKQN